MRAAMAETRRPRPRLSASIAAMAVSLLERTPEWRRARRLVQQYRWWVRSSAQVGAAIGGMIAVDE
jgi:hypothetical protein